MSINCKKQLKQIILHWMPLVRMESFLKDKLHSTAKETTQNVSPKSHFCNYLNLFLDKVKCLGRKTPAVGKHVRRLTS